MGRKIWFKGQIVPVEEAMVSVLSPTSQYGLNVFEGIRCYADTRNAGQLHAFRLTDHLGRLLDSCKLIGIRCPYEPDQLREAFVQAVRANDYHEDTLIRLTLFVDTEGSWRSDGPVEMFVAPIAKPRGNPETVQGLRACTSTWERINDRCMPPRIKTGANYLNARYADMEARRHGGDIPILLERDGKVAEGGGACLFLLRRGVLATPPLTSSVLESVTRTTLLTLADEMQIKVEEREIDRTELYLADEVFFCGTAAEITPLTSVDGLPVGSGVTGPVTRSLWRRYLSVASNEDSAHASWLYPVYE